MHPGSVDPCPCGLAAYKRPRGELILPVPDFFQPCTAHELCVHVGDLAGVDPGLEGKLIVRCRAGRSSEARMPDVDTEKLVRSSVQDFRRDGPQRLQYGEIVRR